MRLTGNIYWEIYFYFNWMAAVKIFNPLALLLNNSPGFQVRHLERSDSPVPVGAGYSSLIEQF